MIKYEYKVLELKKNTILGNNAEKELNKLGQEGWELAGIAPTSSNLYGMKFAEWVFVLKRELHERKVNK